MKQLVAVAILAFALPALPVEAATVYKCTDAAGKTTYSERACPDTESAETLRVRPAPEPDESTAGATEGGGKTLDQRIAEATDPVVKAQLEIEKQRCELAATQLQRYADAPYLVEKQADGSERRLSDAETKAEKDKLQRILKERCQ